MVGRGVLCSGRSGSVVVVFRTCFQQYFHRLSAFQTRDDRVPPIAQPALHTVAHLVIVVDDEYG